MIDINNSPMLAGWPLHLTCDQPAAIYTAGELQVWRTVEISYAALACPNRASFKASMNMDARSRECGGTGWFAAV